MTNILLKKKNSVTSVSHQKAFIFEIVSASIPQLLAKGCMPWGGAGGQNIEHPHTLVSLSSVSFFCQMHFNFIGKVAIQASYAVLRQLLLALSPRLGNRAGLYAFHPFVYLVVLLSVLPSTWCHESATALPGLVI